MKYGSQTTMTDMIITVMRVANKLRLSEKQVRQVIEYYLKKKTAQAAN